MDDAQVPHLPLEDQAYQLHCEGYSYRQIAGKLDIDKDTVTRYIRKCKAEYAAEHKAERETWIAQAVERLRAVERAAWGTYRVHEDIAALNTIITSEEKIARLRGLYAQDEAAQHQVHISVDFVNDWRKAGIADAKSTAKS